MEHRNVSDFERSGQIADPPGREPMSYRDRLSRWAAVLEKRPLHQLYSLHGTEYRHVRLRDEMRCDDSPLSVAWNDPVLRADGLADDTYGAARHYFGLTDGQLHYILCSCHCGERLSAQHVAWRVRSVLPRRRLREVLASLWQR